MLCEVTRVLAVLLEALEGARDGWDTKERSRPECDELYMGLSIVFGVLYDLARSACRAGPELPKSNYLAEMAERELSC